MPRTKELPSEGEIQERLEDLRGVVDHLLPVVSEEIWGFPLAIRGDFQYASEFDWRMRGEPWSDVADHLATCFTEEGIIGVNLSKFRNRCSPIISSQIDPLTVAGISLFVHEGGIHANTNPLVVTGEGRDYLIEMAKVVLKAVDREDFLPIKEDFLRILERDSLKVSFHGTGIFYTGEEKERIYLGKKIDEILAWVLTAQIAGVIVGLVGELSLRKAEKFFLDQGFDLPPETSLADFKSAVGFYRKNFNEVTQAYFNSTFLDRYLFSRLKEERLEDALAWLIAGKPRRFFRAIK